jgi:meso-butanediol dehydrogenase / (S,S)-butanediol dehydrogenase / diacetyl reductase
VSNALLGKVAIVTGAASGIGRAIACRFTSEGAQVIAVDMVGEALEVLAAEAGEGRIIPVIANVAEPADVARVFPLCRDRFGKLDVLANNAGRTTPRFAPLHELSVEEWDSVMAVNWHGAFAILRGALAMMVECGGGAIVNTVSISALKALPNGGAYSTSKAALAMLTRQAAVEYAGRNIRVNGIMPGVTATPILDEVPQETMAAIIAGIPQNRLARPEEVAAVALFLASDEASYVNGALLSVDGAASA